MSDAYQREAKCSKSSSTPLTNVEQKYLKIKMSNTNPNWCIKRAKEERQDQLVFLLCA
jgi:hypothetical protein